MSSFALGSLHSSCSRSAASLASTFGAPLPFVVQSAGSLNASSFLTFSSFSAAARHGTGVVSFVFELSAMASAGVTARSSAHFHIATRYYVLAFERVRLRRARGARLDLA